MKHYTIEEIKNKMADRNLREMASRIGISEGTLYNLGKKGSTINLTTYEKIVEYLFGDQE